MKIAIMGSGGVGGYYGGRLAAAGNEVTFIARGAHLEALRGAGLQVESALGDFQVNPVAATDDPGTVGETELVVMSIKTYALDAAISAIGPMVGDATAVLPLLNGVDIAQRIGAVVGMERVLGGLCGISSFLAAPGMIQQVSPMEFLKFGEWSGEATSRAREIGRVLKSAGINAELSGNIEVEVWNKFLFLAAFAGISALTRMPLGPLLEDPDTRALMTQSLEEIAALARASGVVLPDDVVPRTLEFMEGRPGDMKPSLLWDLERGNRLELDALTGAIVRMGTDLGVETPVNKFIYTVLKPHAGGGRS